nr:LuxR family transcriptional regulator [uncultured Cohaesibacter sp.]
MINYDKFDTRKATSRVELIAKGTAFCKSLGCNHFAYLLLRPPTRNKTRDEVILTNYPDEWVSRYIKRNYKYYDPVALIYKKSRLPFFWGQQESFKPMKKAERAVMHEARAFGLFEGYAIPTAGPEGDFGGLTVCCKDQSDVKGLVSENEELLQFFSAQFHAAAVRILFGRNDNQPVHLTSREQEVLCWAAEGCSSDATAKHMGLSAPTVNYHISNSCLKLGASNKIQAVALAIKLGYI